MLSTYWTPLQESLGPDYRPLIALCNDRLTFLLFRLFLSCWTSLKPFEQFFCQCKRSLHSLYKTCSCRSNSIWFSIWDLESIHATSPLATQHKLANSLLRLKQGRSSKVSHESNGQMMFVTTILQNPYCIFSIYRARTFAILHTLSHFISHQTENWLNHTLHSALLLCSAVPLTSFFSAHLTPLAPHSLAQITPASWLWSQSNQKCTP